MVTINYRFDNDDHYDGGNSKQYIVIHDTGNTTDSDEGNANYFCSGSRNSSAHYFVDDNSITQIVRDDDCSWHCGDGGGAYGITNRNSIGIEMCRVNNGITGTTENNTLDLVRMLMSKYGVPSSRVVRHYDASRKICPQAFSANGWARWNSFKSKLDGVNTQPTMNEMVCIDNPIDGSLHNETFELNGWALSSVDRIELLVNGNSCGVTPLTVERPDVKAVYPQYNKSLCGYRWGILIDALGQGANTLTVWSGNAHQSVTVYKGSKEPVYDVRYLQSQIGATVDGIAGSQTLGLCPLLRVGSQGNVVKFLQSRIGAGIDGVFGNGTRGCVITFQRNHGLVADGIVGRNTWRALLNL